MHVEPVCLRIIFSKDDKNFIILIIEIAPRGEVYNKL